MAGKAEKRPYTGDYQLPLTGPELLAGRYGQDQKRILLLRIKSDPARTILDSARMSYGTTTVRKSDDAHQPNIAPVLSFRIFRQSLVSATTLWPRDCLAM